MILSELIHVAIVPFAIAAGAAYLAQRLRLVPPAVWAVAVGLGYVAGQFGLASRGGGAAALASLLQPREAVNWLPYAVFLAVALTIAASYVPRAWLQVIIALSAALTIGLPLRLLSGSSYDLRWSPLEKLAHIALIAAVLGLTWLALAPAREGEHPRLRPPLLIIASLGTAVVVALSGVFVYGELCAALAAALAGTLVVSRSWHLAGAAGVVTFSLGSLIVLSSLYAQLTTTNAALLFVATMMSGCRMPELVRSRPAWQQAALRTALTLVPLAIALAQAITNSQSDISSSPYSV